MDQPTRLSILSFTSVFPRPEDPCFGIFVQSRLREIARYADLRVVAPVAWIEYWKTKRIPRRIPRRRLEDGIPVRHPRWFYLPGIATLTPFFLAGCTLLSVFRENFDVLDSHFGHPDGIAAALLAIVVRRPFTVTLRGNEPAHARRSSVRFLLRWALRRASRVITVSHRLADFAIELGVDSARITTIPNGIQPTVFYPRCRDSCRAALGMREQAKHILSVGYLIERKGHHHILEAVAALRDSGRKVHLWIVGNPGGEEAYQQKLLTLLEQLKLGETAHFVPGVDQDKLAEYMTGADVVCLASSREGCPNVLLEALACGCPVVASDVGGVPDILPIPRYGIILPSVSTRGFRQNLEAALVEALDSKWDRASISAWGLSHTWRAVALQTLPQLEVAARAAHLDSPALVQMCRSLADCFRKKMKEGAVVLNGLH